MTPEEGDLRRALEARSGAPSPEFRARLTQALTVRPDARSLMPAIALATAAVLSVASVGVLIASRHVGRTTIPGASGTRTSSPTPSSSPSWTPPARQTPPFPLLPLTHVDFSCRLPVLGGSSLGFDYAFIDFPSRRLSPTNNLGGGRYYDPVVDRWLTFPPYLWSPDGREYAITDIPPATPPAPTHVHIVDAATGVDARVFTMPDAQSYGVLEFTTRGVELVVGSGPGVWRLDPTTGSVVKVSDGFYAPEDEWIGVWDPRDVVPTPISGYPPGHPADRIEHRDANGTVTSWFYLPGKVLTWMPFVGSPAVLVEVTTDAGVEYWLVSGPSQSTRLATYSQSSQQTLPFTDMDLGGFYRAAADAHGIWLGGGSMYLITASGAIERVDDRGGFPAGMCT